MGLQVLVTFWSTRQSSMRARASAIQHTPAELRCQVEGLVLLAAPEWGATAVAGRTAGVGAIVGAAEGTITQLSFPTFTHDAPRQQNMLPDMWKPNSCKSLAGR